MMVINPDSLTEVTEHTREHHDAPLAGAIKGEPNSPIPSPLRSSDPATRSRAHERLYARP